MSKHCIGLLLIGAVCVAGCAKPVKPLPKTYPVHGKVTYKDGTLVRGGFVQFNPADDGWVTTTGAIQSDGTYRLTTKRDGLSADGAVPGMNRVTIVTQPSNDKEGRVVPISLQTPYNVEPRDNEFNLKAER